jgi:hypothetical protein
MTPLPEPLPSAARERVVEALTRHFANDSLTEAELEARLQSVYAATTTRELDAITADLPVLPASETLPIHAGQTTDITALFGFFSLKGTGRSEAADTGDAGSVVGITGRAALGFAEATITS